MFVMKYFITNVVFSLTIFFVCVHLDKEQKHSNGELFLYCLGLGSAFTTLLLYYLIRLFPKYPSLFYLAAIIVSYCVLLFLGRKGLYRLYAGIVEQKKNVSGDHRNIATVWFNACKKHVYKEKVIWSSVIAFCSIGFLYVYYHILQKPLDGNDILEYAAQGKTFYISKYMEATGFLLNPNTGFYRPSVHAPGFSLLLTWEYILGEPFGHLNDDLFRSIPAYYGLLIMIMQVIFLSRLSKWIALLGIVALVSSKGFYQSVFLFHLDTYRMFFLSVSLIFLAYAVSKRDFLSFLLLGVFLGLASFAHSLGAIISCFSIVIVFVFLRGSLYYRFKWALFIVVVACIFGGSYYVSDALFGTGWIF